MVNLKVLQNLKYFLPKNPQRMRVIKPGHQKKEEFE